MIRNIVFDMGMVLLDHDPLLPCIRHAGRERAQALCDGIFWHPEWMELLDGGVMDEQAYICLLYTSLRMPAPGQHGIPNEAGADLYLRSGGRRLLQRFSGCGGRGLAGCLLYTSRCV